MSSDTTVHVSGDATISARGNLRMIADLPDFATNSRFAVTFAFERPSPFWTPQQIDSRDPEIARMDRHLVNLVQAYRLDEDGLRMRFIETQDFTVHKSLFAGCRRSVRIGVSHLDPTGVHYQYVDHTFRHPKLLRMRADASKDDKLAIDVMFPHMPPHWTSTVVDNDPPL